jgi:hypothetical protein
MISQEMLRLIAEEREREVQAQVRVRRLLAPHRPAIRWHHREHQPSLRQDAATQPR